MTKILIISDHLLMAGAERLIYELVHFAKQNDVQPTVLIINNYNREYYDSIFKEMKIKVIRTRVDKLNRLRSPFNLITAIYWRILLKFSARTIYKHIHIIGLYNVDKIIGMLNHRSKYFWHVNNALQYTNHQYPFPAPIFQNAEDTIIFINKYQIDEIKAQYGTDNLKSDMKLFKLFVSDI